ncbi:MAG TPA: LLM class flavin-dependent oxidoreductase [Solirubrobacteraceae bacterium]|nr:LLM class flavin-dependent oxidoreductase [Solirubrobacteraceae bacterium]
MTSPLRLSVLDQSPVSEHMTGSQALQNTLDLARLADTLGYHRYWVAEHHGGPSLAGPSPEALIGPIAANTQRIRVGSGGVMLPHYSPLKVAESFSLLSGLFPGRIDLALGRASGTDPITTFALQRDRRDAAPDDFPQQLAELLAYLGDTMPADHPFARYAKILPGRPETPEVWLLGSSPQSAIWAAELNLPYSFADFINREGAAITADYRANAGDPHVSIGVWVVCAETDEEAEIVASSGAMMMALLQRGELVPVPPTDRAMRFIASQGIDLRNPHGRRRRVVGTPDTVMAGIEQVAEEYGAEEVIVVTITYDHAARRRSYELIAEAFGLDAAPRAPEAAATRR